MTITAAPQRGLKLDWTAVTGAFNYRIDRDVDATDGVDTFGSTAVAGAAAPTQSHTFTDLRLVEAMNHRYRIRALADNGTTLATAFATVSGDLAASIDSVSNPVDDSGGNRARVMATALRDQDVVRHVLAVGLPGANQGMGLVKVYERLPQGGAWTEVQTLSLPQAALGDFFGASVALSPHGLWLAVGVPGDDHATAGTGVNPQPSALAREVQDSGAVQVYQYVAGQGWTPHARFKALNAGAGDAFGTAVAISDQGHLLVGAPNEDSAADPGVYQPSSADSPELGDGPTNIQDRGAVYAYANTAQGYAFDAYVKPLVTDASQSSMYFGAALAMDATGQRVAVGAPRASYDGALAGGVAFYSVSWAPPSDPPWTRWNLLQTVGPGGDRRVDASTSPLSPAYRGLGGALSMSADGNWLAAGYAEKGGLVPQTGQTLPANAGQVAVYRFQNNAWTWHSSPVAPAPRANDRFGSSLALVNGANGPQLLVGTPEDGAPHQGLMRAADIVPVDIASLAEAGAAYCFVGNASDPGHLHQPEPGGGGHPPVPRHRLRRQRLHPGQGHRRGERRPRQRHRLRHRRRRRWHPGGARHGQRPARHRAGAGGGLAGRQWRARHGAAVRARGGQRRLVAAAAHAGAGERRGARPFRRQCGPVGQRAMARGGRTGRRRADRPGRRQPQPARGHGAGE
ncbi:hypothetical protein SOM08_05740 [Hydrogenophaga sp. SNF1]|uniref:hypothetical protein n=1 Tax=Hydrogenophaga sp. SNF1 TaxID=3098762 RepID=UPI002ACC2DB3|nr:hypothetical protein [Hydrogenophaga sp. SNF1]WQB84816.1 hypothetical protein SOM08_05740 [Hydrogenophaga sp. SNF1]